nr:hypothetical protein [Tanacetum cinerariifolium]
MCIKEVVFKIHTKGHFEYDPLRKTKNGSHKGKEKAFEDEGMCSKGNKAIVTNYNRAMIDGKAKMVEEFGVVKTRRDRGVVIRDLGVNNVEGNAEVGSKRGVRSMKMHESTVKVYQLTC